MEEAAKTNTGVYFVSGNHEWKNGNVSEFLNGLAKRNVKILNNKNAAISKTNYKINICGIDDFHTKHSNLNKAVRGVDKDIFTVLLSHSPDVIKKLDYDDIDLIISGHTHGGQVRLPLLAILSPGQGVFPRYSKGIYKVGRDTVLYIDSGLGTSKIPVRLFNRSQLSLITIRGK